MGSHGQVFGLPYSTGQFPGTNTNDNAGAGKVGQFVAAGSAETSAAQQSAVATISIASPAIITWTGTPPYLKDPNGVPTCAVITFATTGALPTGIVASTNYYVIGNSISGSNFQIASSVDNALAGIAINTSGTQSGTHTATPFGILANGVTINYAGMLLPAGDYEITLGGGFLAGSSTSITSLTLSGSLVSASADYHPAWAAIQATAAQVPGLSNTIFQAGPRRLSLAAPTTIYFIVLAAFTVNTLSIWGGGYARRER